MTPTYLTALAERLYPKRFVFALISVSAFLIFVAWGYFLPPVAPVVVPLIGPLVFLPWAAFCVCSWFHPALGSLRPKAGGRAAVLLRKGMRWYAAVFVTLYAATALAVLPALTILRR